MKNLLMKLQELETLMESELLKLDVNEYREEIQLTNAAIKINKNLIATLGGGKKGE